MAVFMLQPFAVQRSAACRAAQQKPAQPARQTLTRPVNLKPGALQQPFQIRERSRIERLRSFEELGGQVDGTLAYATALSQQLNKVSPEEAKDVLKTLLLSSRDLIINDDRMHRRASMEREELEGLIQWVERNGQ